MNIKQISQKINDLISDYVLFPDWYKLKVSEIVDCVDRAIDDSDDERKKVWLFVSATIQQMMKNSWKKHGSVPDEQKENFDKFKEDLEKLSSELEKLKDKLMSENKMSFKEYFYNQLNEYRSKVWYDSKDSWEKDKKKIKSTSFDSDEMYGYSNTRKEYWILGELVK